VRLPTFLLPTDQALPRLRLLFAFPALLLVIGIVLVTLEINGSSSGAFYDEIHEGSDPSLISGHPQEVRSDEWNVGTVWTIAQLQQGLPERTATIPGGMDAALPYDLPTREWSVAFRPHLLGYVFLDVATGTAWRWWSMGFALMAAAYGFVLTILPRRPVVAVALSIAFFLSPFFQWWYQSSTLWPVTWALVVLTGIVWSVRSPSCWARWLWGALIAYLTAVMAMGIYLPFIVPVVLVVLFFGVGVVIERRRAGQPFADLAVRVLPVFVAGAVGAAVTALWLWGRRDTVAAFLGTVYPGERRTPTGDGGLLSFTRALGSSFSDSLKTIDGFLGLNSSEASTFVFVGVFLLPMVAWVVWKGRHDGTPVRWSLIALVAVMMVFAAYVLVPGWDTLAKLLLLDQTTAERVKIGEGLASFVIVVVLIGVLDDAPRAAGRRWAWIGTGLFVLVQLAIAGATLLVLGPDKLWGGAPFWPVIAALTAVSIFLFARRRVVIATSALLLVSLAGGLTVNPLYIGVLDLRETPASRAIVELDASRPGTWIGLGDQLASATVIESGVEAYNGTQGAPSSVMWRQIDPSDSHEAQWNRIGGLRWAQAPGEPTVSNPAPDQILVTFDACSRFVQGHVDYVLSNESMTPGCLTRVSSFETPEAPLVIYRIVAP
jgi:hypothetical protein